MFSVIVTDNNGNSIVIARRSTEAKAQDQADAVRAALGNFRTGNSVSITVEAE